MLINLSVSNFNKQHSYWNIFITRHVITCALHIWGHFIPNFLDKKSLTQRKTSCLALGWIGFKFKFRRNTACFPIYSAYFFIWLNRFHFMSENSFRYDKILLPNRIRMFLVSAKYNIWNSIFRDTSRTWMRFLIDCYNYYQLQSNTLTWDFWLAMVHIMGSVNFMIRWPWWIVTYHLVVVCDSIT